jgi:hypothetical protein
MNLVLPVALRIMPQYTDLNTRIMEYMRNIKMLSVVTYFSEYNSDIISGAKTMKPPTSRHMKHIDTEIACPHKSTASKL